MAEPAAKVRSPSEEKKLDEKIEAIRRKNVELEQRSKIRQSEAKQVQHVKSGADQCAAAAKPTPANAKTAANKTNGESTEKKDGTQPNNKNTSSKQREWDSGKVPAEEWKMNVPELGDRTTTSRRRFHAPGAARRQTREGGRPGRPGFQHDDRFLEAAAEAAAEDGAQKVGPSRPASDRAAKADPQGRKVPFRNQRRAPASRPLEARKPGEAVSRAPRGQRDAKRRNAASEDGLETANEPAKPSANERKKARNPRPPTKTGEPSAERRRRPPNNRHQVRLVVRQLVNRVVAAERRPQKPPPAPKESEV